jgi:hypothetical protein
MFQDGDVAMILVRFIEERDGKALVRLPSGSKTSLPFECLDLVVRGEDLSGPLVTDDLRRGPLLESNSKIFTAAMSRVARYM